MWEKECWVLHAGKGAHSDQKELEYLLLRWGEDCHLGSEEETLKNGVRGRMKWWGEVWGLSDCLPRVPILGWLSWRGGRVML